MHSMIQESLIVRTGASEEIHTERFGCYSLCTHAKMCKLFLEDSNGALNKSFFSGGPLRIQSYGGDRSLQGASV
jgi:hypothetical protein